MATTDPSGSSAPLSSSNASTTIGSESLVVNRSKSFKYHSRRPSPDMPIVRTASVGKRRSRIDGATLARASPTGGVTATGADRWSSRERLPVLVQELALSRERISAAAAHGE